MEGHCGNVVAGFAFTAKDSHVAPDPARDFFHGQGPDIPEDAWGGFVVHVRDHLNPPARAVTSLLCVTFW